MKAVVYTEYGPPDVLHLKDVPKPVPQSTEVLVRVRATTVTIGDVILRSGRHPDSLFYTIMMHLVMGLRKPKQPVLGMELAGDIEAVGGDVTRFQTGDAIFASTFSAGYGGYAEYKCLPQDGIIALKPQNVSYEQAAAIPGGGMTALGVLRKANIQAGQMVLVYGASGAVGTNAVQLARHFGAEVTAVCSTANLDWVQALGAERVIDYTNEDFTASGAQYDVVFDAVGKLPASQGKKALRPNGIYLNVRKDSSDSEEIEDLIFLQGLVEAGALTPVIDRSYPLEEIVDAHRYVEKGHKKGNVAVAVAPA